MDTPAFLFFAALLVALIYASRKIWTDPQEYLNRTKEKRHHFVESITGKKIPSIKSNRYLEGLELWFSRFTVVLLYLIFLLGIIVALISR